MLFETLSFNSKRIYPTLVMSTMSSGKSTLINALAGKELLPNGNQASTARAVAVMDNDLKPAFEAHIVDRSGHYTHLPFVSKEIVAEFNDRKNEISEMILEGQIRGVKNSKKSLLLIDTPGINNFLDPMHATITEEVIGEFSEGLILYVINVCQIGTDDDSVFLQRIARLLRDKPGFQILFAANKMDCINLGRENPIEILRNCKEYIQANGIENPYIIPISAHAALLFRMLMNGDMLTEAQLDDLLSYFGKFQNRARHVLQSYSITPERGDADDVFSTPDLRCTRAELYAALENTGLPMLEATMDEFLVRSGAYRPTLIRTKKEKKQRR